MEIIHFYGEDLGDGGSKVWFSLFVMVKGNS